MSKYMAILNTVKHNRGSEALARGVIDIIIEHEPDAQIFVVANDADIEQLTPLPGSAGFIRKSTIVKGNYLKGAIYLFLKKILKQEYVAASMRYAKLLSICKDSDSIICFGGDNYDIRYGMYQNLHELHSVLRRKCNAKMIMYDCSLGEEDLTSEAIEDFLQFDEITVRECISESNLKKVYHRDNVHYYPDPAFAMKSEKVELPNGWENGKMVGINLSELILDSKYGGDQETLFDAYQNLVKRVIDIGFIPVFVPHVMAGQDYLPLSKLCERCRHMGKMILLDECYNAAQLKYIISNCTLYVGARTHSTIAAYSSCIPTLAVGYSVKSRGIATDLFGTDEHYVISVQDILEDHQLADGFQWLYEHQDVIRERLTTFMPEYIEKASASFQVLKNERKGVNYDFD